MEQEKINIMFLYVNKKPIDKYRKFLFRARLKKPKITDAAGVCWVEQ